jgi:hypothetical protein
MSEEKNEARIHEIQEIILKDEKEIERLESEEERILREEEHRHHHPVLVEITVDSKPRKIRAGEYIVSALKAELEIPPAKELERVLDGMLTPLLDTAKIDICGGEVFISHARRGGSSSA